MLELFLLILGLAGLWLGTELVITGAVNIADYFELSQVFVGIAILAIGTDLPEIVIAINASLQHAMEQVDTSGIVIGNAIGSCFSQISAVMGIAGLLGLLTLTKRHVLEDGFMLMGSVLLLILLGYDGHLSRIEGVVLILVYLIYYFTLLYQQRIGEKLKKKVGKRIHKDIFLLVTGMVLVIFTAELVVDNAVKFAEDLGVKQSFVGIILIGLGTSLPELALSLNAARKRAQGLSVGNLIGSNIFDLLIPVGLGATIAELRFEQSLVWFDLPCLFGLSLLVLYFLQKKRGLQRTEALTLIGIFSGYAFLKLLGL